MPRSLDKKVALACGLAALLVVGFLALSWRELAVRYLVWRLGSEPERFDEALKGPSSDPLLQEALTRFVRSREGAGRLISAFLRGYELSAKQKKFEPWVDGMERMLIGLYRTEWGPTDDHVYWDLPFFAVVKREAGLTFRAGQYEWRSKQVSIDPAVLSGHFPLAAGREVRLSDRPGVKARIVSLEEAKRVCSEWPGSGKHTFERYEGMPPFVCLLERESRGGR